MEKKKRRSRQLAWTKLDNTANLFPVIASESLTNVYRISAVLTEEIDPELLNESVEFVAGEFLNFRMRLRKGVFWYYFEENDHPLPKVTEENDFPTSYINKNKNNQYLFRVTYYGRRINLEVFHALSDGYGGLIFLKEIVYQYLRKKYPEALSGEKDKISSGVFLDQEDSYVKNFRSDGKQHKKTYTSRRAVTLKGEYLQRGEVGVLHCYMPVDQLKKAAKGYSVTINQFLVGAFIYSVYRAYLEGKPSAKPISCCVPVNLRPYYDSHTLKNFFVMVSAVFKPEKDDYSFEEVLPIVADSLKEQTTKENLEKILEYNVSNERNFILRMIPLTIKNIAIRQVYQASAHGTTSTVTNIGNVDIREPYIPYIKNFSAMLAMSKGQNMKGAISSYQGILTITFTTVLADPSILKQFVQCMTDCDIEVAVETNGAYDF